MHKWEYLVLQVAFRDAWNNVTFEVVAINENSAKRERLNPSGKRETYLPKLWEVLSELGQEGWEIINATTGQTGGSGAVEGLIFVAKRPI